MIKTVLIDDEENASEVLEWHLKSFPQLEVFRVFQNAFQALEELPSIKPDLIFLDIHMPGMSGFELLERLTKPYPAIIFVSAHDEFAIRAFRYAAVDYLLKPIVRAELEESLNRTLERISDKQEQSRIEELLLNIQGLNLHKPKIAIPSQSGIDFIDISEILYCKADNNYTEIHLADKRKLIASKTLKDFEQMLQDKNFFRIHQSWLINMGAIKRLNKQDGGWLEMEDGTHIPISRSKKEEFMNQMKV
ncbi:MAG: LytTR family DNA-binding domain-containing protein [Bacteroidetes bacterium]|nr:LytTR family DNA-binding domain-containing protein [Bacteroidota bacterium]